MAKSLRFALGSLIIQAKYQDSDRELVDQLTENPYYPYFIGFAGYQEEPSIDANTLVLFRKRLKMDIIVEANDYMLDALKEKESNDNADDDHTNPPSSSGSDNSNVEEEPKNEGTHGIRLSGPKLGKPSFAKQSVKEKKHQYQDHTDRIEVERSFSLSKCCYGLGVIKTKLYDTTLTSIA